MIHLHGGYYRQLVDNDMSGLQRKANYKAISQLEGVIVLGESLKPIFQGMLSDDKIFVVPNCVDDEYLMSDEEFDDKIRTIDQRKVKHLLYLSNFIRSKGYPEVLEMAKLEKERVNNGEERKLHFDFAGKFFEETEKQFFCDYIKENGLEDYVTYHGVVGGDKKRELLRVCDIFVLLTRYPNEGQPISILEAMGNGMAIITTDHAGIPDIVKNGENGIVVKKNEVFQMKEILFIATEDLVARELRNRYEVKEKYMEIRYKSNIRRVFNKMVS